MLDFWKNRSWIPTTTPSSSFVCQGNGVSIALVPDAFNDLDWEKKQMVGGLDSLSGWHISGEEKIRNVFNDMLRMHIDSAWMNWCLVLQREYLYNMYILYIYIYELYTTKQVSLRASHYNWGDSWWLKASKQANYCFQWWSKCDS